jgi:glycosyltransferase involved in cell wall biosynthesis
MSTDPQISIVVPVYNEEENVRPLVEAVRAALADGPSWELLLVDDGSGDRTRDVARALALEDGRVRVVPLARNFGQTPAMQAGFDLARGRMVVSMDGDLQNDPADIPRIVATLEEGYDLVGGYRENRQDKLLTRKIPSWIANRLIRRITGVSIRDNGCSLKGYRRELLDRVHLYSDMHRFIPAVAAATAGARITEIPVRHHARKFGRSKYGLSRIAKVLADLLTIMMIRSFRERPLAMFFYGALAALVLAGAFGIGGAIALRSFQGVKANSLVLPAAASLWLGLAIYLLMLGLIAEIALRERRAHEAEERPLVRETLR